MESREDIPRVSVDSVQDWHKVRAHYKEAALLELQKQVVSRGIAHEKDAIILHLEQFIDRTFSLAQPNLRINGHNFESLDEDGREMDLFDETLDRRIWSLADTRLQWHKRIAETRRTVPIEIGSTISALLEQHRELDTNIASTPSEELLEEEPILEEDDARQRRIDEVLQKTSALAHELEQTVSQQQERGNRVKVIATEVKSLRP